MANDFLDTIRPLGLQVREFDYSVHIDNVGVEWQKWLRSFEAMIQASRIYDENWKHDLMVHYAGSKVQILIATLPEISANLTFGPLANIEQYIPHISKYERTVAKLNKFFLPRTNTTYERHILRQMKQKSDENIDMFTIRLRIQADKCDFGLNLEENVKDQIIQNCQSAALRRDLLKRGDESLKEILQIAKVFETVAQQEKLFNDDTPQTRFDEIYKISSKSNSWKTIKTNQSHAPQQIECYRCGFYGHMKNDEKCPAFGKFCNNCGGRDHFSKKCRLRKRTYRFDERNISVNKIKKTEDQQDDSNAKHKEESVKHITDKDEYVFNVTTKGDSCEVQCKIGGVIVNAIIDSGSKYNLMSQHMWETLKSQNIIVRNQRKEIGKVFKAYGGYELPLIGAFTAELDLSGKHNSDFYVIKGEGKLLIGRETATKIGVLKIDQTINKIEEEKIMQMSKMKGVLIDTPIKNDAAPVVQPYRRIPIALEKAVDRKIDELLAQDIIEKVNGPTKWISPMVVIPKGNDIRLCIDMRRANEAIERENYPLPTIEDFLPHLGKGKVFSKLDVKNAFHQV